MRNTESYAAETMFIALYDESTNVISFPYEIEKGARYHSEPFELGPGITSTVIKERRTVLISTGEEALGILHRFGPPVLLITDLSLPRKDGFAVIEAVREQDEGRSEIIAWSAVRELREFAAHRLGGLHVRILSGTAAPGRSASG